MNDDERAGKTHILGDALRAEVKELLREVIREELTGIANGSGHPTRRDNDDGLVNVDIAAEFLSVSKAWLYKNSNRLPFARKIGGALRFDRPGMRRWLESRPR
jgi:predicted DNA-binding transcriptional regulator AlpA